MLREWLLHPGRLRAHCQSEFAEMMRLFMWRLLEAQKDLSVVQEANDGEGHSDHDEGSEEIAPVAEGLVDGAANDEIGVLLEFDKVEGKVNSDRVGADPD